MATSGSDDQEALPGLGPRSAIPRVSANADWGALRLDDAAGFVLSRVDGRTTLGEILQLTPFPEAQTRDILVDLLARGAIDIGAARAATRPAHVSSPSMPVSPTPAAPDPAPAPAAAARGDDGPPVSADSRRRIDELWALLSEEGRSVDPHQLLGVAPGTDRKELKRAYFRLSKEFHPDRYFGKDIGEDKRRLQRIFTAINEAYEALDGAAARQP